MSSKSNFDDENKKEGKNTGSSKTEKEIELNLETRLGQLQVKELTNEAQSSTPEGIEIKKRFSTTGSHSEEPLLDTPRGALSNWRSSSRTHIPRETKTNTSVSSSWRDPTFKYERCGQNNTTASISRGWRNEDPNSRRANVFHNDGRYRTREHRAKSFDVDEREHSREHFPSMNREMRRGNWTLCCAPDIVLDNGLTEAEHVKNCVEELHKENRELFAINSPYIFESSRGGIKINCYTSNCENKAFIAKVADRLAEKIGNYPYCFYYFYDKKPVYMRTYEGEFYEFIGNNWKIIDFFGVTNLY